MTLRIVIGAALLGASALAGSRAAGAAASPPPQAAGDAAHGRQLFMRENCYYCHGTAGQGGRDGARIAAIGMNLQAFIRYVRRPAGAMPAFTEKILSDQDLTDIYAFLQSLPAAKPASEIPLLRQLEEK